MYGSKPDVAARHAAVLADHVDELVGLVGADRLVGKQHRGIRGRAGDAHARKEARRKEAGSVGDHRASPQGRGALVETVIEKIQESSMREAALVWQPDLDGSTGLGSARGHAALG